MVEWYNSHNMYSSLNKYLDPSESHPHINAARIEQYNAVVKRIEKLTSEKSKLEFEIKKQNDFSSFVAMGLGAIVVVLACFFWLPDSWILVGLLCCSFVIGLVGDLDYDISSPRLEEIKQILKDDTTFKDNELRAFQVLKKKQAQHWLSMSGHLFEKEVAELFSANGYQAQVTKGSGDGGIDIFLEKDGIKYGVQCKNHHGTVGPAAIRDLYGAMSHEKLDAGIFIASSGYTKGAREFASNKRIQLLDINDVLRMHASTLI
jgi:Restriction endonuclease